MQKRPDEPSEEVLGLSGGVRGGRAPPERCTLAGCLGTHPGQTPGRRGRPQLQLAESTDPLFRAEYLASLVSASPCRKGNRGVIVRFEVVEQMPRPLRSSSGHSVQGLSEPLLPPVRQSLLRWVAPPLAVALGLLGRAGIEQLLLGGAGDDVQEQPLAGAQHQGLAWYSALEQLHLVRRQVESAGGHMERAPVHGQQHVGRAVVDDRQAVRRVEAVRRLLRRELPPARSQTGNAVGREQLHFFLGLQTFFASFTLNSWA